MVRQRKLPFRNAIDIERSLANRVIMSPQQVREIVNTLARARVHLVHNRRALSSQLIQHVENKLNEYVAGKEKEDGQ